MAPDAFFALDEVRTDLQRPQLYSVCLLPALPFLAWSFSLATVAIHASRDTEERRRSHAVPGEQRSDQSRAHFEFVSFIFSFSYDIFMSKVTVLLFRSGYQGRYQSYVKVTNNYKRHTV